MTVLLPVRNETMNLRVMLRILGSGAGVLP